MKNSFCFKKIFLIPLFLLFSSKNFYSKSEKLNEKKDFVKSFFSYIKAEVPGFKVPKNLTITGNLDVTNNQTVGGNLTVLGDINTQGTIYLAGNFLLDGTLNLSGNLNVINNLTCSDLTINNNFNANGNINLNTTTLDGKINIGSSSSGEINIDSGSGIYIGSDSNAPIVVGNLANTSNINFIANKNSGLIKFSGKSLVYDITDIQKPNQGYYKYLAVDSNGNLLTINTSVGGDSLDIDNLTVNTRTDLFGTININSNSVGETNIGGNNIVIGKANAQDLGIYGKNIQIGSNGVLMLGYVDEVTGGAIQITGKSVTMNGADLFFDFNSIEKPTADDFFNYLVIDKTGKISSLTNFDSTDDLDGNFDTLVVNNSLTVLGDVTFGGANSNEIKIGNEQTSNLYLNSNTLLEIDSPEITISGTNLKLNFSNLTLPTTGTSYLKVDENGNVELEETLTNNEDNSTFSSVVVNTSLDVTGEVNINTTGNGSTKIGTDTYTGNITIGNANCGGITINGGVGNLEIGKNTSGNITIGSTTTPLITINTKSSGQLVLYGNNLSIDLADLDYPTDPDGVYYLYVDENKKLKSKEGILIENQSVIQNLNVSDSANLNGEIYINKDSLADSITTINGETITLGSSETVDFNIYSKNSIISSKDISFLAPGTNTLNGKIEIIGGDLLLQGNSLNLNFEDIDVAAEGDLNYLVVDSFGKISSVAANRASGNYQYYGNFYINSNLAGTTQIGNTTSGGEVTISSIDDISIEGANIILNAPSGNIVLNSSNITTPSTGNVLPLKINSDNEIITDVSSRRFKKNIKDLNISRKAIKSLVFKKFNYKKDESFDYGLIAEDLIGTEFEKAVIFDKDGNALSVNYRMVFSSIFADYLKACQELEILKERQNEIEELLQKVCNIYSVNKN